MEKVALPTYETLLTETIRSLAVDSGIVSGGVASGGNALSDSGKNWAADVHINRLVKIVRGSGQGQLAVIQGNSSNTLIIRGTWPQGISAGAAYVIFNADFMQMLRDVFFAGGVGVSIASIERTAQQNIAVVADADILAAPLTPASPPCLFRLTAGFNLAGILSVVIVRAGNTQVQQFNGGVALNNNSLYMFDHLVHLGDTINYRYSVNATLQTLRVQEIGLGTQ